MYTVFPFIKEDVHNISFLFYICALHEINVITFPKQKYGLKYKFSYNYYKVRLDYKYANSVLLK